MATLHLEVPDFFRPLNDHVINGGEDIRCVSAVYNHCKASNHSYKPEEVVILDRGDRWFERGIQEAIWEWVEQPALNNKGGLSLPVVARLGWGNQMFYSPFVTWSIRGLIKSGVTRCNIAKWVAKFYFLYHIWSYCTYCPFSLYTTHSTSLIDAWPLLHTLCWRYRAPTS